jgi:Fe-S-cluster containining protein
VTRCLSFHATYRCRDSGACCTAGWPIPVEADRIDGLTAVALRSGMRRATRGDDATDALVMPTDAPAETPALLTTRAGACVFYDPATGHHCRVHRAAGHAALPLACRQFPRVVVVDPRGASITLSHFCPTAAALLDSRDPIRIVDNVPAFPSDGEYVGLDARASLPPLLRPNLLMDWDAVSLWERLSVALITTDAASTVDTLARLRAVVDDVRNWRPGEGALTTRIETAFATGQCRDSHTPPAAELIADILDAVSSDLRMSSTAPHEPRPPEHIARRFLAAHAFASWTLHMGRGLRTWLRSLEAADALLNSGYGVRGADRLLRHLADPAALARRWARAERES